MLIKFFLTMYRATDAPLKKPNLQSFHFNHKKKKSIKLKAPPGAENFS